MTTPTKECDAFMLDTYRSSADSGFHAGAITLKKRRTIEVLKWDEIFPTEQAANEFVRAKMRPLNIPEMASDGAMARAA